MAAESAEVPSGIQEYFILGKEENLYRSFEFVAAREGRPLTPPVGMESVITLSATADGQIIVLDHWEDGYDEDPINNPGPTTQRWTLAQGQTLTLKSTEGSTSGTVPVFPRGTALFYDGGDRIVSIGGPVNVVHLMWPLKMPDFGDAWEVRPVQALAKGNFYTIPVGEDSYLNNNGDAGPYSAFKYVHLEIQGLEDGTVVRFANGRDPNLNFILNKGESYSSMGYINGRFDGDLKADILAGTTVRSNHPVQLGMATYGSGDYQNRFYNSVPESIYGTDYVTQTRGVSVAPTELYIFNPWDRPIVVEGYDLLAPAGHAFEVAAGTSIPYSQAMGYGLPLGSGARLMSDDPFYALAAYDKGRNYDWGYTPTPTYYLGREITVPWAPGAYVSASDNPNKNNNPVWVAAVMDQTKVRFDLNGDGQWDLVDLSGDNKASPTHDPAGLDNYYLVDVLKPLIVYDHTDKDATGMRIVADKPIAAVYGTYQDDSERSGSPDWGYTLLPMIRPWLKEVFNLGVTVSTRSIPSAGGELLATYTLAALGEEIEQPSLKVSLPNLANFVAGSGEIQKPDGSWLSIEPALNGQEVHFAVNQLVSSLIRGDQVIVRLRIQIPESAPRGNMLLRGAGHGTWGGVALKPSSEMELYKGALHLTKYADADIADPNATFTYFAVITNLDPTAVTDVVVEDMVPPDVNYVAGSCDYCDYSAIARTLTWNVGLLLPGESRMVSFQVEVKNAADETIISNEAIARDEFGDYARSNTVRMGLTAARLWLEKSVVGEGILKEGDTMTYKIAFGNTGSATAHNPVIRDYLPSEVTYVPQSMRISSGSGWTSLNDGVGDDGPDMDGIYDATEHLITLRTQDSVPDTSWTFLFDVTINAGLATDTTIVNSAILTAGSAHVSRNNALVVRLGDPFSDDPDAGDGDGGAGDGDGGSGDGDGGAGNDGGDGAGNDGDGNDNGTGEGIDDTGNNSGDGSTIGGTDNENTGSNDTSGKLRTGNNLTDPRENYLRGEPIRVRGGGGCATGSGLPVDRVVLMMLLGFLAYRSRVRRTVAQLCVAVFLLAVAGQPAFAQEMDKVNPQNFRPHVDGTGLVATEGAETLRGGTAAAGVYLNYAKDPLVAERLDSSRMGVVERIVGGDLVGTYSIVDRLSVGLHLPFTLNQRALLGEAQTAGVNDLSVWAKGGILSEDSAPVALAAIGRFKMPSGDAEEFMGDGSWNGELGLAFGRHFGSVSTLANLSYRMRSRSVTFVNLDFRDEVLYSVGVGIPESGRLYMLELYGSTPAADIFAGAESPVEVLLTGRQGLGAQWALEVGAGRGITDGYGSPAFRVFSGLRFTTDAPQAGEAPRSALAPATEPVAVVRQVCPAAPVEIDEFRTLRNCPQARFWTTVLFQVVDGQRAPLPNANVFVMEAGAVIGRGHVNEDGALEMRLPSGSYVVKAAAPGHRESEHAIFVREERHRWRIPLTAEMTRGFLHASVRDAEGRPLAGTVTIGTLGIQMNVDSEKPIAEATLEPGIYQIRGTAEGYQPGMTSVTITVGAQADVAMRLARIAPKKVEVEAPKPAPRVEVKAERIQINEQIRFELGKATIVFDSYPLLDEIAEILKAHKGIGAVRIEGHTDSTGSAVKNLTLSEQRAAAVREYLIKAGVEGERLVSVGYGLSQPIADNKTSKGRALNRRVEFMITEQHAAQQSVP